MHQTKVVGIIDATIVWWKVSARVLHTIDHLRRKVQGFRINIFGWMKRKVIEIEESIYYGSTYGRPGRLRMALHLGLQVRKTRRNSVTQLSMNAAILAQTRKFNRRDNTSLMRHGLIRTSHSQNPVFPISMERQRVAIGQIVNQRWLPQMAIEKERERERTGRREREREICSFASPTSCVKHMAIMLQQTYD